MGTRTIELGPNQNKKKPKEISLMALLANSATGASRRLLIRHGEKDASDHKDLELKLAEFYAKAQDKKQIEKEFAEIHPHKDFILKNLAPVIEVKEEPSKEEVDKKMKDVIVDGGYSNCGGNFNCPCSQKSSNACGCSGFDGTGGNRQEKVKIESPVGVMVIGAVAIVALVALIKRN